MTAPPNAISLESHVDHRSVSGGLARAAVFGVSDGLVSNVSLVIGLAGSGVGPAVVRLAGLAGAIAGGASMAAGEWISLSAQNELISREVDVERREITRNAKAETTELAHMYERHGMTKATAVQAAHEVMEHTERAVNVHAREELGVDPADLANPWRAAGVSMLCFLFGALLPVLPWLGWFGNADGNGAKVASVIIGVVAAGVVGALIGRYAERSRLWSAARQVLILLVACAATFVIGKALGVSAG
jgi:VIT1/CCC1 family predicted Fe2+/Mn2+ transporter